MLVITYYLFQVYDDLSHPLMTPWYDEFIRPYINNCSLFEIPDQRAILKFYQICVSERLFGNPEVFSLLTSVGIIILVFLITNKITNTRYAGIIACLIIAYDKIFVLNSADTSQSAEWVFFFLLSIYLIYKKPIFLGFPYILSLFAKGIGLLYAPVIIYWIIDKKDTIRNKKYGILSIVIVLFIAFVYTVGIGNNIVQTNVPIGFFPERVSLNLIFENYNYDFLMLVFFTPLSVIGLIICIISKQRDSRYILSFILYTFTSQLWVLLFSQYGMYDYRMIPTIAFVSIGLGMFSKLVCENYNKIIGFICIAILLGMILFTIFIYVIISGSSDPILKTNDIWFDETERFTFEKNNAYERIISKNCILVFAWFDVVSVTMTCNANATENEIEYAINLAKKELILIQQGFKYSDFN